MTPKRIILLPAYEPERGMLDLIAALAALEYNIIVVNDGSSPACLPLFEEASRAAVVLTHPVNRGKGTALRTGLSYIRDHIPAPYTVITMDADGQHTVPDALRVLNLAEEHPGSLALGCRQFTGHVPARSRFGNTMTRLVFRLSAGVPVSDTQTGLRAFTDALTEQMLSIEGDRYEYEMNVLMTCAKDGVPIREVPIETVYLNNNAASHFHPLRDSIRIYGEILKFSASSFASFLLDYALYCILLAVSGSETLANVAARLISSAVNFLINKKLVFHSKGSPVRDAAGYFTLAAGILVANTAILWLLSDILGLGSYIAKILTELTLFVISFTVQRLIIFRRKKGQP